MKLLSCQGQVRDGETERASQCLTRQECFGGPVLELERAPVQHQSIVGRTWSKLNLPLHVWIPNTKKWCCVRTEGGRVRKQQPPSPRHSLILQSALIVKMFPPFFNQWKLNSPDSWATLEYINIFWQAWLCPPHAHPFALFFSLASLPCHGPSAFSSGFPSVFLCCVNVALTMILISHFYRPCVTAPVWGGKRQGQVD